MGYVADCLVYYRLRICRYACGAWYCDGIVLIALGIAWKVFGRNTIKKKLSVNDVKGIVKEEMEEEKAKGQRQQQKQQKPRKEKSQKKKK